MRIALIITTLVLLGCSMPIDAQIVPPTRQKPAAALDTTMVIHDRGQQLELLPALRAKPTVVSGKPGVQHELAPAADGAPLGPGSLGVVYNHALQTQGLLTGEIAFRPKGDGAPVGFDPASYPGLAKLTNPNTWIVVATSPKEFVALFNRLKARSDLEWVEAVVLYGAQVNAAPARPAKPAGNGRP